MKVRELLTEKKRSEFEILKKNKIALTPEEREQAMTAKAVWHPGNHDKPVCAIWKSKRANGDVVFGCNTHRAYNVAPTLKGAIHKFHSFIKGTA